VAGAVSLRRLVLVCGLSVALTDSMGVSVPAAVAKPGQGSSATAHDKSVPVTAAKLRKATPPANPRGIRARRRCGRNTPQR
jgi:hypothetical protein